MSPDPASFFDKNLPAESWIGKLPHLSQGYKLQTVTFHLGDSLPQVVRQEFRDKRQSFIETHPEPWDADTTNKYKKLISPSLHRYLDNGYGACLFRNPNLRRILSDTLNHRNHTEYELRAYVIMPNHVHLLVLEFEEKTLLESISNVMKYSSRMINKFTGNRGSIWHKEPFDRYVRNDEHYANAVDYILKNPRFLQPWEYELGGPEVELKLRR